MGVKLQSALGGSVELNAPSTASNFTMTVPAGNGTVATTDQLGNFRNKIINGDMRIDQRNNGAAIINSLNYCVDRFNLNSAVGTAFTQQRVTDAPAGFLYSLKITNNAAATATSSQFLMVRQIIEGLNIADLNWGTANAETLTASFWVKSSIAGTYSAFAINAAENRSFVQEFTIAQANTWQYVTFTIPGDITGTWLTDNTNGIRFGIDLGSGTNYNGTSGTWNASWKQTTSNSVRWVGTNGATFFLTGVQLEKGSVATPFEHRPYGTELALCQRYYSHSNGILAQPDVNGALYNISGLASDIEDAALTSVMFPTMMRATPSMTVGRMHSFDGSKYKTITAIAANAQGIGFLNHDAGNSGVAYVVGRPYKFSWIASAEL